MRLKDRVAIVTGGGRGIGRRCCVGLSREGAAVVVADIDSRGAESVAREIEESGGTALSLTVDVADERSVQSMAKNTVDKYGRIDILVNNAGLLFQLQRRPFDEIPVEEWDWVMSVNLRGPFLCCKAVVPYMRERRWGKIINISTSHVWVGTPNRAHYVSSKAGVVGLTRCLARELGDHGIRVNVITPGFVASEAALEGSPPEMFGVINAQRCLKRTETPEDLVGTVLFLASEESDFITGQSINVDGGMVTH